MLQRRGPSGLEAWQILLSEGSDDLTPGRVRDLGLYGGAQGIWVDKARTGDLTPDGMGVAVSVLHTGRSYADDLSVDSLLYHYPSTNRGPNRDASEVAALKWAQRFGLPVFTITPGPTHDRRAVRLSWVEDHDDQGKLFLRTFGEAPEGAATPEPEDAPFFLTASAEQKKALRKIRQGQQQFAMKVFHRYGAACAVCGIDLAGLIDAAHLCAAGHSGSFDARNGLPLCALHHRAFDRGFWTIHPTTAEIQPRPQGPSLQELRITQTSLNHLPALPHAAALEYVWKGRPRPTKDGSRLYPARGL
jgi:putative restriction endonuclease